MILFERLITPLGGKEGVPIEHQTKMVVEEATLFGLDKLFHEARAHHGRGQGNNAADQ